MPRAEENEIPRGQAKGKATEQREFLSATQPTVEQQQASDEVPAVNIPDFDLGELQEPEIDELDEDFGEELDPEEFQLLASATTNRAEEVQELIDWLPSLAAIAEMPGASAGLRALVQSIRERSAEA